MGGHPYIWRTTVRHDTMHAYSSSIAALLIQACPQYFTVRNLRSLHITVLLTVAWLFLTCYNKTRTCIRTKSKYCTLIGHCVAVLSIPHVILPLPKNLASSPGPPPNSNERGAGDEATQTREGWKLVISDVQGCCMIDTIIQVWNVNRRHLVYILADEFYITGYSSSLFAKHFSGSLEISIEMLQQIITVGNLELTCRCRVYWVSFVQIKQGLLSTTGFHGSPCDYVPVITSFQHPN